MTMHLPYEADGERDEAILDQLMHDVTAHSEYVAACLIEGAVHGYKVQNLLIQLHDGNLIHQYWIDMAPESTATHLTGIELNLIAELQALRESHFILRGWNEDIGGMSGRSIQMYLATAQEGEWLCFPSPLRFQTYESNPITRICQALRWQISLNT
jgi:hypothetical protein